MTRESHVPYSDFKFYPEHGWWNFPFDQHVIKTKSWIDLPSPPKPPGIQISVIIINWSSPPNVVETSIASVLNQDFPPENFEVILVDDASDVSPKPACLNILRDYPSHNFRAYFLDRTRSYQESHGTNVGLKRALGWIVVLLQSHCIMDDESERDLDDSYPRQPLLEGTWRHHNARDRLGLCPRYLAMGIKDEYSPQSHFPHPQGLSFRKEYVEEIHGIEEHYYSDAPLLDFQCRLTQRFGIVFAEDLNMQVIHRDYMLPKSILGDQAICRPRPQDHIFPDWPTHWGELTEQEEGKTIMSETMKGRLIDKQPDWINEKWELDKVLEDPAFQSFIDGLFKCEHVKRITLLGSLVIEGYEPFTRGLEKYGNPLAIDIDVSLEYDDSIPEPIRHPSDLFLDRYARCTATPEIKDYLERYELGHGDPVVYIPSQSAPNGPCGRKYRIHIEDRPINQHIVLRER